MIDCFCFNEPNVEFKRDILEVFWKHNIQLLSDTDKFVAMLLVAFTITSNDMGDEFVERKRKKAD